MHKETYVKEMVKDNKPETVSIYEKANGAHISNIGDFWKTAFGICAEHPDSKVATIADHMLDGNAAIPDNLKEQLREEKKELSLCEWAKNDLTYIKINSPEDYRNFLTHVSENRDLDPAIVRGIIHDLHHGIETIVQEAERKYPDLPHASKQPRAMEHNRSAYEIK